MAELTGTGDDAVDRERCAACTGVEGPTRSRAYGQAIANAMAGVAAEQDEELAHRCVSRSQSFRKVFA
jgi:hypothetical protein